MTAAEQTRLSPDEELAFQRWAQANGIRDVDDPRARYDMRGYWKQIASKGSDETQINAQDGLRHFPDTFKQHGHPTFSVESQYSAGPHDGGRWLDDNYVPSGADFLMNARGNSRQTADALAQAVAILMRQIKP